MAKILTGTVVSTSMQNTVVVEVSRRTPHPMYKKLIAHSKKFKVDSAGQSVNIGDQVRIVETKPISKDKHFKLQEILVTKEAKQ